MKLFLNFVTMVLLLAMPHFISSSVSAKPNWQQLQEQNRQVAFAAYRAIGGKSSYLDFQKNAESQWEALGMKKPSRDQSISLLKQSMKELQTGERAQDEDSVARSLQITPNSPFVFPSQLEEKERQKRMTAVNFVLVGGMKLLDDNFQEIDPQEASSWSRLKLEQPQSLEDQKKLFDESLKKLLQTKEDREGFFGEAFPAPSMLVRKGDGEAPSAAPEMNSSDPTKSGGFAVDLRK